MPASPIWRAATRRWPMEKRGVPLLVPGEVTDTDVDLFDREAVFIERVLAPLLQHYPGLRVIMTHHRPRRGAVRCRGRRQRCRHHHRHHLLYNRNAIFQGGVRPLVLPAGAQRNASPGAGRRGDVRQPGKYFLGTDSAPRMRRQGNLRLRRCYTAYAAMELYAEAFRAAGARPAGRLCQPFRRRLYRLPRTSAPSRWKGRAAGADRIPPRGG